MDQIGPIGQDIHDCAAMLEIISGPDPKDPTCIIDKPFSIKTPKINGVKGTGPLAGCGAEPHGLKAGCGAEPHGLKIGIPRNYSKIDSEVKNSVQAAAKELESAGAQIEEFDIPMMEYMIPAYYIIAWAEASTNMSRYDGLKYGYRAEAETLSDVYKLSRSEGFGLEVKRQIILGSFVLSSGFYDIYYKKAMQARALIKDAFSKLFEKYDMILSPVTKTTAYKIGENISDPLKMYMDNIYTVSANLAGLPAVSLPCGLDKKGLPIGFQLIGNIFTEEKLIRAASIYQSRTDFHLQKPSFNVGGAI